MRFRAALLSACAFLSLTAIQGMAQCGPKMEKQIADVRGSWVRGWNDGQLGNVVNLYYRDADLLAADGSRAHGQDEIRASP
jgi:ketosteroid isomerase-like protein